MFDIPNSLCCHKVVRDLLCYSPGTNGGKRRSARKPGVMVTNRALVKSKVGSLRKVARVNITQSFLKLLSSDKNITKTRQTIKNSEDKDEYKLDKHKVSKPPLFLSFPHSKCVHGLVKCF